MKKSIFLFFAAILCSVSVWGYNFYSPYIYFNNAEYNWETAMLFVGHDSYSAGYNQKTNPIPNTKLVYFEPDASWGDQTRFTIGNTQNWEGKGEKFDDRVQWMEHIGIQKNYNFNWHQTYYVTGTSSTINVQYISDNESEGYKSLPTFVAQQNLKIRNTTSNSYSNASDNWPVELKLKGTYLSGKNSSGSSEISGTKSTDGNKYDAIVTGKVTHTYANLSEDYHFEGWGTADKPTSTNASYEYNITANTTVYAFFTKKYPVNFSADANGSVTATANEQALTSGNKIVGGTNVTLTATANDGYKFVNWTKAGEEVSTEATYSLTVTEAVELVANFELKTYTVKFLNYDGEVLQSSTVNHGETPAYNGTTPERTADAQYTYTFSGWDNEFTAVTSDQTYKAQFNTTVNQYTITVNAENGTVTGAGTYDYGTNVTLTATANDGYEFVNWTKAGEEVSTEATYSLKVTENVDLVANFEKILIEIGDGDNSEVLNTYKNKTVDVKVNRTFKANDGYYTICLPFDLPASKIGTAYQVKSITEHVADQGFYMVFDEVQNLEAGQPYLILPNDLTNPTFEDVTITYTDNGKSVAASGAGINFKMVGVINGGGQTEVGQYWVGDNGYFYNGDGTGTTAKLGLRVLFNITDNAGTPVKIRARVVLGENAATSLDNITNGENTTIKVIENGQLIIIRDGEKFNAQGVRF